MRCSVIPAKAGIHKIKLKNKKCIGYILCSNKHGTLYIGITNNIIRRAYEHKQKIIKGFTSKYNIIKLVYTEEFTDIQEALTREKNLKKWQRSWKIELIEKTNPEWKDLIE